MCGIAGIYAYNAADRAVDRTELRAVRDHMAVRGLRGQGEWFSGDGRVAFDHLRSAIIGLYESGESVQHAQCRRREAREGIHRRWSCRDTPSEGILMISLSMINISMIKGRVRCASFGINT